MPGYYQPECWGITSRSAGVLPARVLGYYQPECWGITSRSAGVLPAGVLGYYQPECWGITSQSVWVLLARVLGCFPVGVLKYQPEYQLPARVRGVTSRSAGVSLVGSWNLSSTYGTCPAHTAGGWQPEC